MTQPTRAPARASRPSEKCFFCSLPSRHGSSCRWCSSTGGAISPIADLARKRGALGGLAERTEIAVEVLRRAAVADGSLTLDQAIAVANDLGCKVVELSLAHATAQARNRRAAAARARDGVA